MRPRHLLAGLVLCLVCATLPGAGPTRAQETGAKAADAEAAASEGAEAADAEAAGAEAIPEEPYPVTFSATFVPSQRQARAQIAISPSAQGSVPVLRLVLHIDPTRHQDVTADGALTRDTDSVIWEPPPQGGRLRYRFAIDSLRGESSYDALCGESFAILRGDDLFPPARVTTRDGAVSRSRMRLRVPEGWSIAVPYARSADGSYRVDNPRRRFDRPTGWFSVGRQGILRERVAGTSVAVAAPVGQDVHRHDWLALLRWTLPKLRDVLGGPPERLLIVGAGDPMWRGGLSAPHSLFLHASRPLISNDTTSPLLHEVFHTATGARAGEGGDWIVEGLAELYGMELLMRSRTISKRRYERALARLVERGRGAKLDGAHSSGPSTARAVGILHALDRRIRSETEDAHSLDDVVAALARRRAPITRKLFAEVVRETTGVTASIP